MKNLNFLSVKLTTLILMAFSVFDLAAQNATYNNLNVTGNFSVVNDLIFNQNRSNNSRGLKFQGSSADKDWKWFNLSGDLHFQTNTINNVIKMKQNGNVGIGIFDPVKKLDVGGDTRINGNLDVTGNITGNLSGIAVKGDGKVGIGTDNPSSKLEVVGDARVQGGLSVFGGPINLYGQTSVVGKAFFSAPVKMPNLIVPVLEANRDRQQNRSFTLLYGTEANKDWILDNQGGEFSITGALAPNSFMITNDGKVGIGTNSPTKQLDVDGDTNIDGTVTANSFIGDGSQLTGISATHDGNFNSDVKIGGDQIVLQQSGNSFFKGILRIRDESNNEMAYLDQNGFGGFRGGISVEDSPGSQKILLQNSGDSYFNGTLRVRDASLNPKVTLSPTGTVTATSFVGDGSQLTGINATHDGNFNSDVRISDQVLLHTTGDATFRGTVRVQDDAQNNKIVMSPDNGRITATSFVGDGSRLTGIRASIPGLEIDGTDDDTWVANRNRSYARSSLMLWGQDASDDITILNANGDLFIGNPNNPNGNTIIAGTVTATSFVGDGSGLTGITADHDGNFNSDVKIGGDQIVLQQSGNSFFKGILRIRDESNNEMAYLDQNGFGGFRGGISVEDSPGSQKILLQNSGDSYFNGTLRVRDASLNPKVTLSPTGTVTATSFIGDGSQLTGIDHDGIFNSTVSVNEQLTINGPGGSINQFGVKHWGSNVNIEVDGETWMGFSRISTPMSTMESISIHKPLSTTSINTQSLFVSGNSTFSSLGINSAYMNYADIKGALKIYKPDVNVVGGGTISGSARFEIQAQGENLKITTLADNWAPESTIFSVSSNGSMEIPGEASTRTLTVGNDPGEALAPGTVAHFDGRVFISEEGGDDSSVFGNIANDTATNPNFANYLLWVEEGIASQDFALAETSDWPDYVFETNYDLESLEEVEGFIQKEGHLPHFPAAEEVETMGYTVDDMTKRMVQTIEEMTLHSIAQEKKIQEQNKQIQELFKRLEALESSN